MHPLQPERRSPLAVLGRYALRLLALVAVAGLIGALYVAASPVLPEEWLPWRSTDAEATATAPPPPRPETAPARIPAWAWSLHAWHSAEAEKKGPRPAAAPKRVPAWYWDWRAWRLAVER